ncbi:ABC transporter ATP-binding protein [Pseudothermotoga thermarum]|uniref:ABC transporter related protein n=1 Tax=Pseudothermotoga thermarum DSM 5069 TaxID=688269 RepID=F7YVE9_9THEM|nr:ABC transporter ATP-binding protein [Pseudothermotoga thermarum]AEH50452.1 ABC transporter related protein [Pseudothermotoga thermarum DSM 5069]
MKVIAVKELKKYYGQVKAVDGISFEVEEGTVVAMLGPNGAGKTTTIEILEGLRKKDSGEIYYFGKKVEEIDETIKQMIGVQLQKTAFFEYLTVYETLELFAALYNKKVDKQRIKSLIELVALEEKAKAKIKELSGGQLQRLSLAVALVNDPKIVFLDEPTTGLDPQARRHVWQIVEDLRKSGKTIFLTTHYMEEAEKLADHVLIMDHGKIIAEGTVDQLINSLDMESYVEFWTDQPEKLLEKLEGTVLLNHDKLQIPAKNVEEVLHKLFDLSKTLQLKIDNIVIRRSNLEDVFLKLTGRLLRD